MASASPPLSGLSRDQLLRYGKLGVGALVTAFLGGLFAAWFTYFATVEANNKASLQQQYLSAVQEFSATGAQVDASITELADGVLDGRQVADARRSARQAIAAHAAASQGLAQIAGQGNVDEYVKGLAVLRLMVDDTNNGARAFETSQARFDLMENRTVMVREARRRIYDDA